MTGRGSSSLKLLAVTVLTNLTADDLTAAGLVAQPRRPRAAPRPLAL